VGNTANFSAKLTGSCEAVSVRRNELELLLRMGTARHTFPSKEDDQNRVRLLDYSHPSCAGDFSAASFILN
jgi:hypothetical protein